MHRRSLNWYPISKPDVTAPILGCLLSQKLWTKYPFPIFCVDVWLAVSAIVHISQLINWMYFFHIGFLSVAYHPTQSHLQTLSARPPWLLPVLDGKVGAPPPAAGSYRFSRSDCSCPANDPTWVSKILRVRVFRKAPCTFATVPVNCQPRS